MQSLWKNTGPLTEKELSLIQSGLNLIQQGVSIYDQDLKLVAWNRRFSEIYKIPDFLIVPGACFEDLVRYLAETGEFGPVDINKVVEERVSRARMFEPHYFERLRPDGTTIAVEGHPLKDGGWVAVYTDVTAQKQQEALLRDRSEFLSDRLLQRSEHLAETNRKLLATNRTLEEVRSALTASEERLQVINKSLPAHIAYLDHNLIYRFSNQRLAEIWGIGDKGPETDVVGKHIKDVFPTHVYEFLHPYLEKALGGETSTAEYDNPHADDPDHATRVIFTPEKDTSGNVMGLFVLSTDVTDQRRVANSIVKAQRLEAVTQLTGGLAHDLNNILTIVLGNLSRLNDQLIDTGGLETAETIASTQKAARRAARIMECLVAFSRRRTLEPRETDITRVLRELYNLAVPNLPPEISLSLNIPDVSLTSFIDESAFQDAVINLLFNARDALHGQGKIIMAACKAEDGNLLVTIEDNGHGFDEDMLEKAYEPFFTTKEKGAGTGLGLSMVQGFALQSGGDIWIESKVDQGARVYLKLPAMKAPKEAALINDDQPFATLEIPLDVGPILLVEDQEDIRAYIRHVLRSADLTIIEAASAIEALDIINAVNEIDLIISDINMPGDINGLDFVKKARQQRPELGIILMSGLAETDPIWVEAIKEFDTLRKPFDSKRLHKAILQALKYKEQILA